MRFKKHTLLVLMLIHLTTIELGFAADENDCADITESASHAASQERSKIQEIFKKTIPKADTYNSAMANCVLGFIGSFNVSIISGNIPSLGSLLSMLCQKLAAKYKFPNFNYEFEIDLSNYIYEVPINKNKRYLDDAWKEAWSFDIYDSKYQNSTDY